LERAFLFIQNKTEARDHARDRDRDTLFPAETGACHITAGAERRRRRRRRFISMLNIRMSRTSIEGSPVPGCLTPRRPPERLENLKESESKTLAEKVATAEKKGTE
jgi:hypothetical protein